MACSGIALSAEMTASFEAGRERFATTAKALTGVVTASRRTHVLRRYARSEPRRILRRPRPTGRQCEVGNTAFRRLVLPQRPTLRFVGFNNIHERGQLGSSGEFSRRSRALLAIRPPLSLNDIR